MTDIAFGDLVNNMGALEELAVDFSSKESVMTLIDSLNVYKQTKAVVSDTVDPLTITNEDVLPS